MSDTPTRANTPDDPAIEAQQEEYQIVEPPQPDGERPVDESVADPEAPLVEVPQEAEGPLVEPMTGANAD